ncbi:unnamed protein product [Triticum turgidum subsp. durum]|uniref:Uncharacterized protein n=1 Tax=Triticum turgidum subsp. durum TaxID=4567 RepID=A0A9R0WEU5_TRITD|nr:unnamed protein product [Triticum turgidum subsp. durum]
MSYDQMLSPLLGGAGRSAWTPRLQQLGGDAVTRQILKCTRWQLEETTDFVTCPYHYYCDSSYPGDYHSAVGALVAAFAAYCFVAALAFAVLDLVRSGAAGVRGVKRKYLVPSGPFLLPLVLLALAKGQRVNAGGAVGVAAYSLVAGLVFLCVFGKVYRFLAWVESRQSQWKSSLCHTVV